ncbi:MAG TPA: hypothetical protein VF885_21825 [Arthrobacter sp.]
MCASSVGGAAIPTITDQDHPAKSKKSSTTIGAAQNALPGPAGGERVVDQPGRNPRIVDTGRDPALWDSADGASDSWGSAGCPGAGMTSPGTGGGPWTSLMSPL